MTWRGRPFIVRPSIALALVCRVERMRAHELAQLQLAPRVIDGACAVCGSSACDGSHLFQWTAHPSSLARALVHALSTSAHTFAQFGDASPR